MRFWNLKILKFELKTWSIIKYLRIFGFYNLGIFGSKNLKILSLRIWEFKKYPEILKFRDWGIKECATFLTNWNICGIFEKNILKI